MPSDFAMEASYNGNEPPSKMLRLEEGPEDADNSDRILEALSNGIVMRKLDSFLSLKDLKTLRLVCRRLCDVVMEESNFLNRSMLTITKRNMMMRLEELEQFRILPKNVSICSFVSKDMASLPSYSIWNHQMSRILANVENLELVGDDSVAKFNPLNPSIYEDGNQIVPQTPFVLSATKNLKKLTLNGIILKTFGISSDIAIQDVSLNNLIDLSIKEMPILNNIPVPDIFYRSNGLQRLMVDIRSISGKANYNVSGEDSLQAFLHTDSRVDLWNLILNNKSTLVEVSIRCKYFWDVIPDVHGGLYLPKLLSLELGVSDASPKIINFLRRHSSQLFELSIGIPSDETGFPESVLDEVLEVNAGLQTLKLYLSTQGTRQLLEDEERREKLRVFQQLRTFEFRIIKEDYVSVLGEMEHQDIWSFVPSSVKRLKLEGCVTLRLGNFTSPKLETLKRITYLSLKNCFLTNEFVQTICKELTQLTRLKISNSPGLTDKAFIHIERDDEVGSDSCVSISNLKNLRSLELTNCGISCRTLQHGIKFPVLKKLDISQNNGITRGHHILLLLLSQNPALESLIANKVPGPPMDLEWTRSIYPQFKRYIACMQPERNIQHLPGHELRRAMALPEFHQRLLRRINRRIDPRNNPQVGPHINLQVDPRINEDVEPHVNEEIDANINDNDLERIFNPPVFIQPVEPNINDNEIQRILNPAVFIQPVEPDVNENIALAQFLNPPVFNQRDEFDPLEIEPIDMYENPGN